MCFNCRKCSYCVGDIIYVCERLASCCAATSVVTCVVTTLLVTLALGVGLGYNYCFVDLQTGRYRDDDLLTTFNPDKPTTSSSGHQTTNQPTLTPTQKSSTPLAFSIEPTMVLPLFNGIDFSVLIQKIKERKKNCTLHLIMSD